MSRFLFVVPPLAGHIHPAAALAGRLTARGHEVAWAGHPPAIHDVTGAGTRVYPCARPGTEERPPGLRAFTALRFLWEDVLVPLAHAMVPGVERAVRSFRPDVIVADQQAFAGALVAERMGIPYATSATTSAEFENYLHGMDKVGEWIGGLLGRLRADLGDPRQDHDLRFSPHLVLAFTSTALVGSCPAVPQARFVGPPITARHDSTRFPWEWIDADRRTVLISVGTVNADTGVRFLRECAAAVEERGAALQAVVVDPGRALAGRHDADVLALARVPQLALMEKVSAVICHAGHNTVAEALYWGVPLVVAPIRDDQPVIAAQVEAAGAGIRVRFGRGDRHTLGAALDRILDDPSYGAAARRIGESFHAAGGTESAATCLEDLAQEWAGPRQNQSHFPKP